VQQLDQLREQLQVLQRVLLLQLKVREMLALSGSPIQ
jgi:hypothetical protein